MLAFATIAILELLALAWLIYCLVKTRRRNRSLLLHERRLLDSEEILAKLSTQDRFAWAITAVPDRTYVDVSAGFERMTGYARQEVLGRTVFEIPLWMNRDRSEVPQDESTNGFAAYIELQYRHKNGEVRFAEVWEQPLTIADQPSVLTLAIDVTARTRAIKTLQEKEQTLLHAIEEAHATQGEFGSRMIRAQEEERTRLARELHDDINQRLALLANGIERLDLAIGSQETSTEHKQLRALSQLTNEIVSDIQTISHQLHPAKLQFLGLSAAVRGLCNEFSRQYSDITIAFDVVDLPRDLDDDLSLNLFRALQECLRNIAKHSHAHSAKIALFSEAAHLILDISDDGAGFAADSSIGKGLGLISIQERLRQVEGTVTISSAPGSGTHIRATAPLRLKGMR